MSGPRPPDHATEVLPRSWLYVPGSAPDKIGKALDRGADALILDLEDAVPPAGKDAARATVVDWVAQTDPGTTEIWVRVNSGPLREADVRALAGSRALTGLVLAKATDAEDVAAVAGLLDASGDRRTRLVPLLETAGAVLDAREIAAQPRVRQLQVGEVDLCADAGITPGPDEAELAWVRSAVVLASAAAGIAAPVGPVSRLTDDPEALRRSTAALRRLGFAGRACIHPAQLSVVHAVFTPSSQEVEEAEAVVAAFGEADRRGSSVVLDRAGRLIDPAVIRGARRTVQSARRAGRTG